MNRRELNRHMHSHHKGAEAEYLASAPGDGKVSVHEMAHAEGIMDYPHEHDPMEGVDVIIEDDRRLHRTLNQHMHWQHGGADRLQHRQIHEDTLFTDHTHEWPLDTDALTAQVAEAKEQQMRVHRERSEQVARSRRERGTQ